MDVWKLFSVLLILVVTSCQNVKHGTLEAQHQYNNHLVGESSPYLLQHAHNPVDWYPWGDEALKKAEEENKLIVISVGYAACHWCHVMEEESFEDSLVAKTMNDNFVSIKVDREERPDIDKIYMDAAYLMTGRGGWPLNVIALPNGKPIFAGTYFPKEDWIKILEHVQKEYQKDPAKLQDMADKVTQGINSMETIELVTDKSPVSEEELSSIHENFMTEVDLEKGGRNGTQKFPTPSIWNYLMKHYYFTKDPVSLEAVNKTLTAMARGGIYDPLGGGFARYSTDEDWTVPHFEKMLYDNAQLISLYSKGYQLTGDPLYKQVVMETTEFVNREMTDSNGGFYSSYDADSEGEEGKFYVWTEQEMREVLGNDADLVIDYFGVEPDGNWEEGKNILLPVDDTEAIKQKYNLDDQTLAEAIEAGKAELFDARTKRVHPGLDDKILTSWNALMICGYLDAYRVFKKEEFLQAALTNAQFLIENAMDDDGRLNRNYKDGKSSINGFLDDYGFLIQAFIGIYEATFDEQWLRNAEKLTEYAIDHFYNPDNGMFYYTSDQDPDLITRKMELADNVIPSSNSNMAQNLYYLGTYIYQDKYIEMAEQMLINIQSTMEQQPIFYSNWANLMLQTNQPLYEVAIVGDDWMKLRAEFDQYYLPNVIYLGGTTEGSLELLANKLVEGQTTIYVCENKTCRLPVRETRQALGLMDQELLKGVIQ